MSTTSRFGKVERRHLDPNQVRTADDFLAKLAKIRGQDVINDLTPKEKKQLFFHLVEVYVSRRPTSKAVARYLKKRKASLQTQGSMA